MTDGARPGWTPPLGTNQRIRNRAIWAVAFFAASVMPAIVGIGMIDIEGEGGAVAMPIAFALWAIGALFAVFTAFTTLRYWEALPTQTRLLGALPLLTVSFFLTAALITALNLDVGRRVWWPSRLSRAAQPQPAAGDAEATAAEHSLVGG